MAMVTIRPAETRDRDRIWEIFHEVVSAGDTYPFRPDTPRDDAMRLWLDAPKATYVAEVDAQVSAAQRVSQKP